MEEIRSVHPSKMLINIVRFHCEKQQPIPDRFNFLVPDHVTVWSVGENHLPTSASVT